MDKRKLLSAAIVATCFTCNVRAGTTTWKGAGGNNLWGNSLNWSNGLPGPNDEARFAAGFSNFTIDLGAGEIRTAGTINFNEDGLASYRLINGTLDAKYIQGAGFTNSQVASDVTRVGGGTITLGGGANISGSIKGTGVDLDVNASFFGMAFLSGANTYDGPTHITTGSLIISGNGSIAKSPLIEMTDLGGLDTQTIAATDGVIGDTATVRMNGGIWRHVANGGEERVGAIHFASDVSVLAIISPTMPGAVRATQLIREPGTTVEFRSIFPNATGPYGNLRLDNVPTLSGDGVTPTRRGIAPWAIGNSSAAGLTDLTFMTYDRGANAADPTDDVGFRGLAASEQSASLASGENVKLSNGTFTQAASVSPNSLIMQGATISLQNSAALTVGGGGLLFLPGSSNTAAISGSGTLICPGELVVHTMDTNGGSPLVSTNYSINVPINAASLTKSGRNTITLTRANNIHGTTLNEGYIGVNAVGALGDGSITIIDGRLNVNVPQQFSQELWIRSKDLNFRSYVTLPVGTTVWSGALRGDGDVLFLGQQNTDTWVHLGGGDYNGTLSVGSAKTVLEGDFTNPNAQFVGVGELYGNGLIRGRIIADLVSPGIGSTDSAGPGRLTLGDARIGDLREEVFGTSAGTGYDQIVVLDRLQLSTNSVLDLQYLGGFISHLGDQFILIDNRFNGPMTGRFRDYPEGMVFAFGNTLLQITYLGGDGNDVILTAVPEPHAAALILLIPIAMRCRQKRSARR